MHILARYVYCFYYLLANMTIAYADVSSTATLASDYLFNGVTQTDEKPALQLSLDWSGEKGVYAGTWASNVDFGDDTDMELDGYLGVSNSLTDNAWYDIGLAYYAYLGGSNSSDINYYEPYLALGYKDTSIKFWYSPDYAGTDAKHYIIALMHSIKINEQFSINLQVDKSESLDDDLFSWEEGDKNYIHWKSEGVYHWQGIDFSLGIEGTDLDSYGDTRVVAKISHTFDF